MTFSELINNGEITAAEYVCLFDYDTRHFIDEGGIEELEQGYGDRVVQNYYYRNNMVEVYVY